MYFKNMNEISIKKAGNYIGAEDRDLNTIIAKIKILETLNHKVQEYLDPALAPYCRVANKINNTLILMAANGSIATQLRFLSIDLLIKFENDPILKSIKKIECKVSPSPTLPPRLTSVTSQRMPLITPKTAQIIRDIAKSISDPDLKEIMEKIANRR